MIGKAAMGTQTQQADQDEAGRIQADPQHHERAEHCIGGNRKQQCTARETQRIAAARHPVQVFRQKQECGAKQGPAHAELDGAARELSN